LTNFVYFASTFFIKRFFKNKKRVLTFVILGFNVFTSMIRTLHHSSVREISIIKQRTGQTRFSRPNKL